MNREPIALYLFRFTLGLGLFAFMAMLYWSSLLLEHDVKALQNDLTELKRDLSGYHGDLQSLRGDLLQALLSAERAIPPIAAAPPPIANLKSHYPNLLQPDPFYTKTLPMLLGTNFKPHGALHSDALGKPDNFHPLNGWAVPTSLNRMCSVSVAQGRFGIYETLAPNMALRMEERPRADGKGSEFWVFLRKGVYWQPLEARFFSSDMVLSPFFSQKHPVTAHDFKLHYDAVMNPHVQLLGAIAWRTLLDQIENFEVVDDWTFVVRWHEKAILQSDGSVKETAVYGAQLLTGGLQPLPCFVFQRFADSTKILEEDSSPDSYRKSSVWAQNFAEHWAKNVIVGCGAWFFDGMSDEQIRFKRNPNHYDPLAALAETSTWNFRLSPDALWQDFKAGLTDSYLLQQDKVVEWEEFQQSPMYISQRDAGKAIKRLDYTDRAFAYVGWNEAKPLFENKKVRQALTMAIDRDRIIAQNLSGLGIPINGPFFPYSSAYDATLGFWPYDPKAAKRLLEEEGWFDSDGDGILDKAVNGERIPFAFAITYYVNNTIAKGIAESINAMLREVGISCQLQGVDVADLSRAFDDKSFDALLMNWTLGDPPEDPTQIWHSKGAKQKGSSNMIGFVNPQADAFIEELTYTHDRVKRNDLYHRLDAIFHEEQPYTFLFSYKRIFLYRDYLQNVFIPAERQDLIPGADITDPQTAIFWIKEKV